jgi:two-component system phosphate regulon sensor histidine kinase PhoR
MRRSSWYWRLCLFSGVLGMAGVGLLGARLLVLLEQRSQEQLEKSLRLQALLIREMVRGRSEEEATALVQQLPQKTNDDWNNPRITLLHNDGRALRSDDPFGERPEVLAAGLEEVGIARERSPLLPNRDLVCVALRTDDPNGCVGFIHLASPWPGLQHEAAVSAWPFLVVVLGGMAVCLLLTLRLLQRLRQPLRELTRAAERISTGSYGHQVYVSEPDELAVLARAFNQMSERLAVQFGQLREDRQQLRTILSGMVEGVVALDNEQRILFANDRAAQLLDFQVPAAVGRKLWEVVRHRSLYDVVRRVLSGRGAVQQEVAWNGSAARCLAVHAARLPGEHSDRGAVLVLHDTSELRRLERHRQDFVANVSHELKTPLSVIKACIETLLDGAIDDLPHRGKFLDRIAEQSNRLHALILDLLSLNRIESGAEVLDFRAVPLTPVVAECLERHRARAEAKNQTLEAVPPTEDPNDSVAAWADEEAIGQILDNLVDNAVKYTAPGSRIQVRWRHDKEHVFLEVEDNGCGIPAQDLPRIFERFYRVDKARSRELGGTGLGLSIVKHLAQAMHGNVRAASRLGEGTTFMVRLPRSPLV